MTPTKSPRVRVYYWYLEAPDLGAIRGFAGKPFNKWNCNVALAPHNQNVFTYYRRSTGNTRSPSPVYKFTTYRKKTRQLISHVFELFIASKTILKWNAHACFFYDSRTTDGTNKRISINYCFYMRLLSDVRCVLNRYIDSPHFINIDTIQR